MSVARAVKVIPAKVSLVSPTVKNLAKKRVAAYARVSTASEEQLSSYEARLITIKQLKQPDWEFVKV